MGRPQPLAGIRVIDFCWVLAGPLGTRILASFGAEVIHVESQDRTGADLRPPDSENPNLGAFRNLTDPGKRSFTVDPRTEAGRALLLDLIAESDFVTDNFRPGVLERMGFGYLRLRARNPGIIVLHLPGCAPNGPWAGCGTFGNMILGASGMSWLSRFPGRPPRGPGVAYADFTSPYLLVTALLGALRQRRRTGEGQEIWLDQLSAAVSLLGVEWMQYATGGPVPGPRHNRDPNFCPHGVYPTRGEGEYCAMAVDGDAEWGAVCALIGDPALARDDRFSTHARRKAHEDAIDERVAAWTRDQDRWRLAERLQDAGIAAAAVADLRDSLETDPYLRDLYQRVRQPSDPDVEVVTVREAIHFRGSDRALERAPELGEHNEGILRDLLGLSEREVAGLETAGTVSSPGEHRD